jgi:hypothetical protein
VATRFVLRMVEMSIVCLLAPSHLLMQLGPACRVVMAAVSIANTVKTSLGPVGLDKMLVDDVGVSDYSAVNKLPDPFATLTNAICVPRM